MSAKKKHEHNFKPGKRSGILVCECGRFQHPEGTKGIKAIDAPAKHTPGPWDTTEDGWIYPTNWTENINLTLYEQAIAKVYGVSDRSEANARLIAAAPELLKTLKDVKYCILNGSWPALDRALETIEAATAKAEGR